MVARFESTLPADDDHPYRTGAWRPNTTEWSVTDCDVDGRLPDDLNGVYLRNTENPLHPAIGRYHPFDGDGMIHAVEFGNGTANYRNRFVRTAGFEAELAAGGPIWAGLAEPPSRSQRDGWGARTRLKDSSSTDVVVHAGVALTSFYQCGDLYGLDPITLEQFGAQRWSGRFPDQGVSAHPKVDPRTGELLFFNYATSPPYLNYGVLGADRELAHYTPVELPGPRLPHDMVFTERYAVLNDCPLFWDPELLRRGIYAARFHRELPTRIGVIPRYGTNDDMRWFEAAPTYVLHWINAYEEVDAGGDEIVVVDGYFECNPSPEMPADASIDDRLFRYLDSNVLETKPYRWRLNLRTGAVDEGFIHDRVTEFGTVNPSHAGRDYRYVYSTTASPGAFLFDGLMRTDVVTGATEDYRFGEGVFGSEAPMAPRDGATAEDDGYVVTFVSDMNRDCSECLVFDARSIADGPIARVRLPERICSGTHATWWPTGDRATATATP
jgi:carotenoid cleavage dioxygenase